MFPTCRCDEDLMNHIIKKMEKRRKDWDSFYTDGNPQGIVYSNVQNQQRPTGNDIFVVNSFFNLFSVSAYGGCIRIDNSASDALIEETSFTQLSSSNYAVALYLYTVNIVYNKICGYDIKTSVSNSELFDQVYVTDSFDNKDRINLSSIAYINAPSGYYSLSHGNGQIIMNSLNISNNKCTQRSAINCGSSKKSGEVTALFSYSTFVNNSATSGYSCLYFYRGSSDYNYKMQSCNVISNKQTSNSYGLISSYSPITINNTCILNNEATLVIAVYNNFRMTLIDTFFDKENAKIGTIVVENGPATSFINALVMHETGKCIASFDSFGKLTAALSKQRKSICYKSPCHIRRGYISVNLILVIQCCILGFLSS